MNIQPQEMSKLKRYLPSHIHWYIRKRAQIVTLGDHHGWMGNLYLSIHNDIPVSIQKEKSCHFSKGKCNDFICTRHLERTKMSGTAMWLKGNRDVQQRIQYISWTWGIIWRDLLCNRKTAVNNNFLYSWNSKRIK